MNESISVMIREPGKEFRYYTVEDRRELAELVASGAYKIVVPFPKDDSMIVALVESSESGPYCCSIDGMDLFGVVFFCNRLNGEFCSLTNYQFRALYEARYPIWRITTEIDIKRITEKIRRSFSKHHKV